MESWNGAGREGTMLGWILQDPGSTGLPVAAATLIVIESCDILQRQLMSQTTKNADLPKGGGA